MSLFKQSWQPPGKIATDSTTKLANINAAHLCFGVFPEQRRIRKAGSAPKAEEKLHAARCYLDYLNCRLCFRYTPRCFRRSGQAGSAGGIGRNIYFLGVRGRNEEKRVWGYKKPHRKRAIYLQNSELTGTSSSRVNKTSATLFCLTRCKPKTNWIGETYIYFALYAGRYPSCQTNLLQYLKINLILAGRNSSLDETLWW